MTIYEALVRRLGREPTNGELKAEVQRIIREGAERGATRQAAAHARLARRELEA